MNKAFIAAQINTLSDDALIEILIHILSILARRGAASKEQLLLLDALAYQVQPHLKAA